MHMQYAGFMRAWPAIALIVRQSGTVRKDMNHPAITSEIHSGAS
jgi:hypothetical protein